jgi:hypothetical protein
MTAYRNTPDAHAEYWDRVANVSEFETVPHEFPEAGGFNYFVAPDGAISLPRATGGYDTFHEDGTIESLIIIGEEIPKEVRPFWVAHLAMHKIWPDDGTPYLCTNHDRTIQHFLAESEPDLIAPYYDEGSQAYMMSKNWTERNGVISGLELERYKRAIRHASEKGQNAHQAEEIRSKLAELGLVLPDDENALLAVNRVTGERTVFTLQTERGNRHKCRSCSHSIPKGTGRLTTSIQNPRDGRDHHHYHPGCVTHVELGMFGGFRQTEPHHPYGH